MGVDLLNVKGLQELDPLAPVVMVNLMRFRERSLDGCGSGWDAYLRYSALTVPMIKARGGTLLWTGDVKAVALGLEAGNTWDYLALVYYPDVAAFIDMLTSAQASCGRRPRARGARGLPRRGARPPSCPVSAAARGVRAAPLQIRDRWPSPGGGGQGRRPCPRSCRRFRPRVPAPAAVPAPP